MAGKRDPYEVLGVRKEASDEEIKKAYWDLAKQLHPDRNPGDAEAAEKFKEINDANDILGDSEKRARFDRYGYAGLQMGNGMAGDDAGQSIVDMMADFANAFFGGNGQRGARHGSDLQVEVKLKLEEAARGVKKSISIPREEFCPECKGSRAKKGTQPRRCNTCNGQGVRVIRQGFFSFQQTCPSCHGAGETISDPCPNCRGRGRLEFIKDLEINIPPGVDTGTQIRYPGEGEVGERGAERGDLYVVVRVKPHVIFQREGQHLICRVPVTYSQAALGGEIEVPTLDGMIRHTLRKGIQSHDTVRIAGLGIRNRRGGHPGDLIVQVVIETPSHLTKRQEELLRELAEIEKSNVSPERKSFLDKVKEFFKGEKKEEEKGK
jgi:molecular chaperone DnaJ